MNVTAKSKWRSRISKDIRLEAMAAFSTRVRAAPMGRRAREVVGTHGGLPGWRKQNGARFGGRCQAHVAARGRAIAPGLAFIERRIQRPASRPEVLDLKRRRSRREEGRLSDPSIQVKRGPRSLSLDCLEAGRVRFTSKSRCLLGRSQTVEGRSNNNNDPA